MKTFATSAWPNCPSALNNDQLRQYWAEGFLAFENLLDEAQIARCREAITEIVGRYVHNPDLAEYSPPREGGNQAGASYRSRESRFFFQLEKGFDPAGQDAETIELKVRKFMWFENEHPVFRQIALENEALRTILRQIFEDTAPVLYQSMALIKPPHVGVEKPWHQDNAYFSVADLDRVAGLWIALDEATPENGCMHILPGGHRAGPLRHHHTTDCEILPDRIDRTAAVPVPLKPGGFMIFHGNLPHQTPPNAGPNRRRALQFHYRAATNELVDNPRYDTIFHEPDGAPASCAAARNRDNF